MEISDYKEMINFSYNCQFVKHQCQLIVKFTIIAIKLTNRANKYSEF